MFSYKLHIMYAMPMKINELLLVAVTKTVCVYTVYTSTISKNERKKNDFSTTVTFVGRAEDEYRINLRVVYKILHVKGVDVNL